MTATVGKHLSVAFAALGLLLGAGLSVAQSADKSDHTDVPAVIKKGIEAGQIKVKKKFDTDVPGLTGYVLEKDGQYVVVYGDHGYLIMGNVISPEGENLSSKYADKYVPKPDLAQVVDQLKATGHLVQQGPDDAPLIYAFADPNCIYCHTLYERAKPLVKAGKLQIEWALVGFLKPSSMGRAAAILTADDPTQALIKNEDGFNKSTEDGAIEPLDDPPDEIKQAIKAHAKAMAAARGTGTPTLVYQKDGHWASKVGAPSQKWLENFVANHS
jgi:thiol:disulfide interchange protein DsbG